MSDQGDNPRRRQRAFVLLALAVAAVVAAGVSMRERKDAAEATISQPVPMAPATSEGAERIDFGSDAALPPGADDVLARVADAARSSDAEVAISATYDAAAGDAGAAAAQARLQAVRHALEANGVAPARLQLGAPVPTQAADAARRVELRLQ